MKHRLLTAACAVLLTACSLAGCGAAESQEVHTSDEMPYGATFATDSSRDIALSFDKRFVDDALADKIYTYYHSIQEKDGEAFGSVMFPLYHAYQLETLYENELSDQQIVENSYDAIKEHFGYDFDYSFIEITDLVADPEDSGSDTSLPALLDQLAKEKGDKAVSEDTQHLYAMYMTRHVTEKGSGDKTETPDTLTGETLYAIQYQNEWYLIY